MIQSEQNPAATLMSIRNVCRLRRPNGSASRSDPPPHFVRCKATGHVRPERSCRSYLNNGPRLSEPSVTSDPSGLLATTSPRTVVRFVQWPTKFVLAVGVELIVWSICGSAVPRLSQRLTAIGPELLAQLSCDMPRGRHASSEQVDEESPAPLATLVKVMDDFFDAYAVCRNSGQEQRVSVRLALAEAVPDDMLSEVTAMLSGQIDRKLAEILGEPFDGRQLCSDLIKQADEYWALQEMDAHNGQSVAEQSAKEAFDPVASWWPEPDGQWNATFEARPPADGLEGRDPGTNVVPDRDPAATADPTDLHDFLDGVGPVPAHIHPNGGGWIADTATVHATAFVGPAASVLDEAKVIEGASIDGTARVLGKAKISGSARIRGDAEIGGHAHVTGNALVAESAYVTDLALIKDSAVVRGSARVGGQTTIDGHTKFGGEVADDPSSLPEERRWARCEVCGRGPALEIKLRSTGGYVVYRTLKSSRPLTLCKLCGLDALHRSQKVSGVGVATLNVFAPYALAQNQKWIVRLKQLPDPT